MVLKTKSCNLLTTPSRSSPRDAMSRVVVDRTALGEWSIEKRVRPNGHELGAWEGRWCEQWVG